jgi:hypothetical protein
VAHELIRTAVGHIYKQYFDGADVDAIVQWFEMGGNLKLAASDDLGAHPPPSPLMSR